MNVHPFDVHAMAAALGGEVTSPDSVTAPGPGHSPKDRSLSVKLVPNHPDGFTVYSHAGDDPLECKDYTRAKLGLAPWEPKSRKTPEAPRRSQPRIRVAQYIYKLGDGTPYLRVDRYENPKSFPQWHWTGSGWGKGKPKGPKIPYRLPELLAAPEALVLIVEGEKDADRLASLGFTATTASEGAGKWKPELATHLAGRCVVILPDNDQPGRDHANQVAASLHEVAAEVRVLALPGLSEKGEDVSDWLGAGHTKDELAALCREAPIWTPEGEAEPTTEPTAQALVWLDDVEPVLTSRYLIKGLLDVGAMSLVFGPPGSAKTFFVMDLAFHVASERPWRGRRVKQAAVLYLATEGGTGAANRLVALRKTYGARNVPFAIRRAGLDLLHQDADLSAVLAMAREVQERFSGLPLLIVVDTLSRAMAGGDENAPGDMTTLIRNLDAIREETGAHMMLVHHAGKDATRGARGHSSLRGATDTEIELRTEGNLRAATVTKQRDQIGDETFAFTLKSVPLGVDDDGDTVSSCIVEPSEETMSARQGPRSSGKGSRVSDKHTVALQALSELLVEKGRVISGPNFPSCSAAPVEDWRVMCDRHGLTDSDKPDTIRRTFNRTRIELLEAGAIRQMDGFVWKVPGYA